MTVQGRVVWSAAMTWLLVANGACSQLGSILGGAGGAGGSPQANQVSGHVEGVDTRTQQIVIQASDGQRVALSYDNQTAVVYQNQNYPVTALERGDQVTARVQSASNGAYYTDLVQVDRSVSDTSAGSGGVQSFQGTVGQIDRSNGVFQLDGNSSSIIVALPYNVRQSDLNTFQNLRVGDRVRLYGVLLNNSRVELRQFY
jgi:exosome complex RNA-binding protein Csl4